MILLFEIAIIGFSIITNYEEYYQSMYTTLHMSVYAGGNSKRSHGGERSSRDIKGTVHTPSSAVLYYYYYYYYYIINIMISIFYLLHLLVVRGLKSVVYCTLCLLLPEGLRNLEQVIRVSK